MVICLQQHRFSMFQCPTKNGSLPTRGPKVHSDSDPLHLVLRARGAPCPCDVFVGVHHPPQNKKQERFDRHNPPRPAGNHRKPTARRQLGEASELLGLHTDAEGLPAAAGAVLTGENTWISGVFAGL